MTAALGSGPAGFCPRFRVSETSWLIFYLFIHIFAFFKFSIVVSERGETLGALRESAATLRIPRGCQNEMSRAAALCRGAAWIQVCENARQPWTRSCARHFLTLLKIQP